MIKKTVKHIHRYRVYFLLGITALFLYYAQMNPLRIGQFMGAKLGQAVGMSTSVPENPFNKLAMQLKEKEERLSAKEAELAEKEAGLDNSGQNGLLRFIAIGIVILFLLIAVNFYYDWHRQKKGQIK